MTEVSLKARPQKAVPGLEGLTVCTDWPKAKSGQPPGAQSAIFNPLLASVMGRPIAQHCTAEQLQVAETWWAVALPAWPRWVQELRQAQVLQTPEDQQTLIDSAKGQPKSTHFQSQGKRNVRDSVSSIIIIENFVISVPPFAWDGFTASSLSSQAYPTSLTRFFFWPTQSTSL